MKDNQKESEKQKMPRMLSLLIWHKGAWHQLVLTDEFQGESLDTGALEEIESPSTEEIFN